MAHHRKVKEGRASCRICRRLLVVETQPHLNGIYQHYRVLHKDIFDLYYNQVPGYLPCSTKLGYYGEERCNVSPGLKRCYDTIDEAWEEVIVAAVKRKTVLFPYRCMGYWKTTHRVRGCHKWHVSRKSNMLNP